mgnify:CR=1 FL=1
MAYETQLFALMNAGGSTSMQKVEMNDEGQLKVDAEVTVGTITVESSGDELVTDTLRVHQVGNAGASVNVFQIGGVAVALGEELAAGHLKVHQVGNAGVSSNLFQISGVAVAQGDERVAGHLRVFHVGDAGASVTASGVARQTNQTAASDAADAKITLDDLGRQMVRTQVRDLTQSAYVQLTTGSETTLLAAGGAGVFHDLLWIVASNNSDAATSVDLRSATAGTVLMTLQVPANSTTGANVNASPLKQEIVASVWTADLPDITGTTISLSALFSKEV